MDRTCAACGEKLDGDLRRKYCGETCRKRYQRGARAVPEERSEKQQGVGSVAAATLLELQESKRLHTALGQTALALAHRIDAGGDTGAGVASLAKQLQATLEAATSDGQVEGDPLDELTRRRGEKQRAAAAG